MYKKSAISSNPSSQREVKLKKLYAATCMVYSYVGFPMSIREWHARQQCYIKNEQNRQKLTEFCFLLRAIRTFCLHEGLHNSGENWEKLQSFDLSLLHWCLPYTERWWVNSLRVSVMRSIGQVICLGFKPPGSILHTVADPAMGDKLLGPKASRVALEVDPRCQTTISRTLLLTV